MIISLTVTARTVLSSAVVLLPAPVAVLAFILASSLTSAWKSTLYIQAIVAILQTVSYAVFLVKKWAILPCIFTAMLVWISGLIFYFKVVRDAAIGNPTLVQHSPGSITAHFVLWSFLTVVSAAYSLFVVLFDHSSVIAGIDNTGTPDTITVEQFKAESIPTTTDYNMSTNSTVARTVTSAQNSVPPSRATPLLPSIEAAPVVGVEAPVNELAIPSPKHTPGTSSFGSINFAGLQIRAPSKLIHPSLQIRHNGRRMDRLRHSIEKIDSGDSKNELMKNDSNRSADFAKPDLVITKSCPSENRVITPPECTTPPSLSPIKSTHGSIYTSATSSPVKSCSPKKPSRLSRLSRLSISLEGLNDISPKKLRKTRSEQVLDAVTTPPADEFNQWEIHDVAWNLRNVSGSSAESASAPNQRSASTASSGVNIITSRGFVREALCKS